MMKWAADDGGPRRLVCASGSTIHAAEELEAVLCRSQAGTEPIELLAVIL